MKFRVKRHTVVQPLNKSYRLIPLTQGQNAIVDAEDFDWLNRWNWAACWDSRNKSFYAYRKTKHIYMSRVVLKCRSNKEVDHKNHDTLDNRKENLRKCTHAKNCRNRKKHQNNTSGRKGVTWQKKCEKWQARIGIDNRRIYLGVFKKLEDAAKAYDQASILYHGEFGVRNLPPKAG